MSADNRCIHNASCEIRTPCVENVILMIDNQHCIYIKRKTKASQPVEIKAKPHANKYACYIS